MKGLLARSIGLALGLMSTAQAGTLTGTVRLGPAPAAGVEVSIACPNFDKPAQKPTSIKTDPNGSYTLSVKTSGMCHMRAQHGNQVGTPFEVSVTASSSKLDLNLGGNLNLLH
jgi:hypothetical protein